MAEAEAESSLLLPSPEGLQRQDKEGCPPQTIWRLDGNIS